MKACLTAIFALLPTLALAHPGHLSDVAGHDHIAAGIAIGVAIGVAIWGALRGARDKDAAQSSDDIDAEPQES